jgi:hypothetical protein
MKCSMRLDYEEKGELDKYCWCSSRLQDILLVLPWVTEKNHQERAKKSLCHSGNSKEVHSFYKLRLPEIHLIDQYLYLLHLNKRWDSNQVHPDSEPAIFYSCSEHLLCVFTKDIEKAGSFYFRGTILPKVKHMKCKRISRHTSVPGTLERLFPLDRAPESAEWLRTRDSDSKVMSAGILVECQKSQTAFSLVSSIVIRPCTCTSLSSVCSR